MGYYAKGSGVITLKKSIPGLVMDELDNIGAFDEMDQDRGQLLLIHYDDKYYEDEIEQALGIIAGYAKEGSIEFCGEDDCLWRFRFDGERFIQESGKIVYDFGDITTPNMAKKDLLNTLIECFETFLDEKKILIPNPEKEQSGESAANIYGTDYGDLESELEEALKRGGVLA